MFIGEYNHVLDEKGRLGLPSKFRKELSKGVVVTKGLDNCLWVYPQNEWNILAERLAKIPISQAKNRSFIRLMLAGAMDILLDNQGRINLPDYLLKYAHVSKEVIVAGLYNRLEIWDEKRWNQYRKIMEKDSNKTAESLHELGI